MKQKNDKAVHSLSHSFPPLQSYKYQNDKSLSSFAYLLKKAAGSNCKGEAKALGLGLCHSQTATDNTQETAVPVNLQQGKGMQRQVSFGYL